MNSTRLPISTPSTSNLAATPTMAPGTSASPLHPIALTPASLGLRHDDSSLENGPSEATVLSDQVSASSDQGPQLADLATHILPSGYQTHAMFKPVARTAVRPSAMQDFLRRIPESLSSTPALAGLLALVSYSLFGNPWEGLEAFSPFVFFGTVLTKSDPSDRANFANPPPTTAPGETPSEVTRAFLQNHPDIVRLSQAYTNLQFSFTIWSGTLFLTPRCRLADGQMISIDEIEIKHWSDLADDKLFERFQIVYLSRQGNWSQLLQKRQDGQRATPVVVRNINDLPTHVVTDEQYKALSAILNRLANINFSGVRDFFKEATWDQLELRAAFLNGPQMTAGQYLEYQLRLLREHGFLGALIHRAAAFYPGNSVLKSLAKQVPDFIPDASPQNTSTPQDTIAALRHFFISVSYGKTDMPENIFNRAALEAPRGLNLDGPPASSIYTLGEYVDLRLAKFVDHGLLPQLIEAAKIFYPSSPMLYNLQPAISESPSHAIPADLATLTTTFLNSFGKSSLPLMGAELEIIYPYEAVKAVFHEAIFLELRPRIVEGILERLQGDDRTYSRVVKILTFVANKFSNEAKPQLAPFLEAWGQYRANQSSTGH